MHAVVTVFIVVFLEAIWDNAVNNVYRTIREFEDKTYENFIKKQTRSEMTFLSFILVIMEFLWAC